MHTFTPSLIEGKLIKRYKRFFLDAKLPNGDIAVAHCANTGSMSGLLDEGNPVWLTPVDDPKRKLKFSLQIIDVGTSLVGVNTMLPNHLVADAILDGTIKQLNNYSTLKKEVKYGVEGKSRIDILLTDENKKPCYVEVKNVTLKVGDQAQFPDAVTTRGAKHLDELLAEVKKGNRAVMIYLTQREDCTSFAPAEHKDPVYSEKLRECVKQGVEAYCYSCKISPTGIIVDRELPITL
jgi:sugar fermentation stimulation protein A